MTTLPDDPFPPRFTIGRVLAQAWRGYRKRFVTVTVLCLLGGFAGVSTLDSLRSAVQLADEGWRSLISELLQFVPAILVAMPAAVVLLAIHAGQPVTFRGALTVAARRCLVFITAQLAIDAIIAAAGLFGAPSSPVLSAIAGLGYLACQTVFLAFNCIYLPTLIAEPVDHLSAVRRAVALASGHWLRLLVIGSGLMLSTGVISACSSSVVQVFMYRAAVADLPLTQLVTIISAVQGLEFGIRLVVCICIATATYHLLQRAKDGRPTHEMARVFE